MSWTRLSSDEDLDDDRTIHAATVARLKALGALSDLGPERQFLVGREEGDGFVVVSGQQHAF